MWRIPVALAILSVLQFIHTRCSSAQLPESAATSRARSAADQYQPNDPWTKGCVYRLHTGHAGKFYNCDCEEQKRFSEFICWKNKQCPQRICKGLFHCVVDDLDEVRQRIRDGACCNRCKNIPIANSIKLDAKCSETLMSNAAAEHSGGSTKHNELPHEAKSDFGDLRDLPSQPTNDLRKLGASKQARRQQSHGLLNR
jgi:hypothetical protein